MKELKHDSKPDMPIKIERDAYRVKRIAKGICIACGRKKAASGHKLCFDCLRGKAARTQEIYYARKEAGICVKCGKQPATPGKVKCAECAKKQW